MQSAHILVVDDLVDNGVLLKKMLRADGHLCTVVQSGQAALNAVKKQDFDLILLDVMMPGIDGLEVTRRLRDDPHQRLRPILLVTAKADLTSVVEGLDAGADDYLSKPVDRRELLARVRSSLRTWRLQQELLRLQGQLQIEHDRLEASYGELKRQSEEKQQLQQELGDLKRQMADEHRLGSIIGRSAPMQLLFSQVALIAQRDVTVLIRGETGTGKELVAKAIHQESHRCEGPFAALNCGAIPEGLLESELFGHEKGAFTGASARKIGRFERAAGGTLFLDEIGDVPMSMQVKLLRVLQEREFERVGGVGSIKTDVRIIAATHKDLEAKVRDGSFRQDLYYRLNVVPLTLPALRERSEDIPLLARFLLEKCAGVHAIPTPELGAKAMGQLLAHRWPGNVRELENVLERSLVLSGGGTIENIALGTAVAAPGGAHLRMDGSPDPHLPFKDWKRQLLALHERTYIIEALRRHRGNMTSAAKETEVDAKTFSRKIKAYAILRREYLGKSA